MPLPIIRASSLAFLLFFVLGTQGLPHKWIPQPEPGVSLECPQGSPDFPYHISSYRLRQPNEEERAMYGWKLSSWAGSHILELTCGGSYGLRPSEYPTMMLQTEEVPAPELLQGIEMIEGGCLKSHLTFKDLMSGDAYVPNPDRGLWECKKINKLSIYEDGIEWDDERIRPSAAQEM